MLPHFSKTFRTLRSLNNLLKRDLERNLARSLQAFENLEDRATVPRVDENGYYKMKYMVDDNGRVKIKTVEKEPGKDWNVQVKEYDKRGDLDAIEQKQSKQKIDAIEGKEKQTDENAHSNTVETKTKADENPLTKENKSSSQEVSKGDKSDFEEIDAIFDNINKDFKASFRRAFGSDPFDHKEQHNRKETHKKRKDHDLSKRDRTDISGFDEMETIFDNMNREFETDLGRTFEMFDPFGYRTWFDPLSYKIEFDPERTSYNMRSVVNDNGRVKIKTARKEPGKDWEVKLEELEEGDKAIEQDKLDMKKDDAAIEQAKLDSEKADAVSQQGKSESRKEDAAPSEEKAQSPQMSS